MLNDKNVETKTVSKNCPQCGAQLEVNTQIKKASCQYCGKQLIGKGSTKDTIKKGMVGSLLNFVENQQKRSDDKKKQAEEEAKREREKTIEFIKKYWKILLGAFIVLILIISFGILNERNDKADGTKIEINSSSSEFKGKNYENVVTQLQKAGFTNIKTEPLDDLVTGWFTKNGEVEQMDINGTTVFNANTSFLKDAKIVITYHTFPQKSNIDSTNKVSSEPVGKSTDESTKAINQEILTVENNKDLASILAVKDNYDPIISEFAKKYAGKTIEFNGNIAHVMPHENYKTRYDFLIFADDYSETSGSGGPSFKFKDVNFYDLHFTGSKIPEYAVAGLNIHIVAKVLEYNEKQALFFLKPISTEIR